GPEAAGPPGGGGMMGMMGGPGGMMGGMRGGQDNIPISGGYLTVQPRLKAIMDAVEYGKEPALLSLCVDKEAVRGGSVIHKDSLIELLPDPIDFRFFDQDGNPLNVDTTALGMSIQALRPNRFTMVFAAYIRDGEQKLTLTDQSRRSIETTLALLLKLK